MIQPIYSYPTKAWLALLAKCVAQGTVPQITRAAVGSGVASIPYEDMTDLVTPLPDAGVVISGIRYTPGNPSADVTVQITLGGMTDGFTYSEVALYAMDPDLGEVLAFYVPRYEYPGVIFTGGAGSVSEVTVAIVTAGAASIDVTVSPGAMLSVDMADQRYSQLGHRHQAYEITESIGETVEESQRRQDAALEAVGQGAGMAIIERSFETSSAVAFWVITEGIIDGESLTTGGAAA